MIQIKEKAVISPANKATLNRKHIVNELFLYSDALFYPEGDFFDLLEELKIDRKFYKERDLVDLQSKYISLFETNYGGIECVPYASWWLNKRLLGAESLEVKKFYDLCGFKFNQNTFKMPWDHIAIELSFLANLIADGKCACAVRMIDEHMGWFDKLRECLKFKSELYYTLVSFSAELINKIKEEGLC